MHSTIINSPLGKIQIECDDDHLLKISFCNRKHFGGAQKNPILKMTVRQLHEYFSGKRKKFSLPISFNKLDGTPFQKKAWRRLQKIPYGSTISYRDEARSIGHPKSCRAVGNANGKNPLPIIIPCHRAVASSGSLGGYSSGIWRKKALLNAEHH